MFISLIDRIWANTVLYLLAVSLAWSIREYSSPLISSGLLVGTTVLYLTSLIGHVEQERKIRALGGHAPQVRTWTPWNVSFLYEGVTNGRKNLTHVFWGKVSSSFYHEWVEVRTV
jgi:hypothetical protein